MLSKYGFSKISYLDNIRRSLLGPEKLGIRGTNRPHSNTCSKGSFLVSEYQQYQEATIEEDEEFDHDEDADE